MKRSIGVTLVGVLIIVLSALFLLMSIFILVATLNFAPPANVPNMPPPEQMRSMGIVGFAIMGLLAGFGIAIGIGNLRLWPWARYAAIVVGFLIAALGVLSALMMLVIPIPDTPGASPGAIAGFKIGLALFYLLWAVLCGGVAIYLLRASVGEQFRQAQVGGAAVEEEPKPIAVFIVAGMMLVPVLMLPYVAVTHIPTLLFGVEISGLAGKVTLLVWFMLFAVIAIALIRRVKNALWAAIGLYGVGILSAIMGFRDGILEHYAAQFPHYGPNAAQFSASMFRMSMVAGAIFGAVPIALLLIGKRKYFAWCDRKQLTVAPPQV